MCTFGSERFGPWNTVGMPMPPKDPAVRRRRNLNGPTKTLLPAEGRKRPAPRWPLAADKPPTWVALWKLPQAVAWEKQSLTRVVARYALLLDAAETPGCAPQVLTQVMQLEDRLGLNSKSMRLMMWEVSSDELAEKRDEPVVPVEETKRMQMRIAG